MRGRSSGLKGKLGYPLVCTGSFFYLMQLALQIWQSCICWAAAGPTRKEVMHEKASKHKNPLVWIKDPQLKALATMGKRLELISGQNACVNEHMQQTSTVITRSILSNSSEVFRTSWWSPPVSVTKKSASATMFRYAKKVWFGTVSQAMKHRFSNQCFGNQNLECGK